MLFAKLPDVLRAFKAKRSEAPALAYERQGWVRSIKTMLRWLAWLPTTALELLAFPLISLAFAALASAIAFSILCVMIMGAIVFGLTGCLGEKV